MHKVGILILVTLFAGSLGACSNELKGDITIDGKAFALDSCRSGQVYGYMGVEVTSKNGDKLKIAQAMNGEAGVFYFPAGQSTGVEMGTCGPFQVVTQNSTINDVKNVKGEASFDCKQGGH